MINIELTKPTRAAAIASVQRYFEENMTEPIGNLPAGLLLDFFIEEIGPVIYNKAITDAQARSRNGQPAHRTTGVARINSTHVLQLVDIPNIPRTNTGTVNTTATVKRRFMSTYSGFGCSEGASNENEAGSSAIPHLGHDPGPVWRTSGCIGHVYSMFAGGGGASTCVSSE